MREQSAISHALVCQSRAGELAEGELRAALVERATGAACGDRLRRRAGGRAHDHGQQRSLRARCSRTNDRRDPGAVVGDELSSCARAEPRAACRTRKHANRATVAKHARRSPRGRVRSRGDPAGRRADPRAGCAAGSGRRAAVAGRPSHCRGSSRGGEGRADGDHQREGRSADPRRGSGCTWWRRAGLRHADG